MPDVNPIPSDYPRVTPYLSVDGAAKAIDFYREVLGATERVRMDGPDGKVGHAELGIGDSVIMLADAFPDAGGPTPTALGGSPVTLMVYVEDVDDVFAKALEAGFEGDRTGAGPVHGDRSGQFEDPFGHRWTSPPTTRTSPRRRWSAGLRPDERRLSDATTSSWVGVTGGSRSRARPTPAAAAWSACGPWPPAASPGTVGPASPSARPPWSR